GLPSADRGRPLARPLPSPHFRATLFPLTRAPGGAPAPDRCDMSPILRGALIAVAAFGLYSTHDVVVKLLGHHYTSFQIIFFSGLLSFPVVSVLLLSDKTDGNLVPRHPWWSLARSVTGVATGAMGFYAFSVLPMAQVYAMLFATPLVITVLAIPMLGERVGLHRGIAVVAGLLGVLIVLRPG